MAKPGDTTKESVSALAQLLTVLDLDLPPAHSQQPFSVSQSKSGHKPSCRSSENNQNLQNCPHSFFSAAQALAQNPPQTSAPAHTKPSGYVQQLLLKTQAQAAVAKLRNRRIAPLQQKPRPRVTPNIEQQVPEACSSGQAENTMGSKPSDGAGSLGRQHNGGAKLSKQAPGPKICHVASSQAAPAEKAGAQLLPQAPVAVPRWLLKPPQPSLLPPVSTQAGSKRNRSRDPTPTKLPVRMRPPNIGYMQTSGPVGACPLSAQVHPARWALPAMATLPL